MKKSFMTRVLAVTLSAAMTFSLSTATNLVTASAASSALSLNVTEKTVDVGTRMVFKLAGSQASKWTIKATASSDEKVARIDKTTKRAVAVEAESAGSAKVWVRVVKTADGREKKLHTDITVNAVDTTLLSVTQTKSTEVVASFSKDLESIKVADLSVVREDKVVIPVKSVAIDTTDKTKATITTFADMKDGKSYTVKYTAPTDAKTASEATFTATNGTIASLGLDTYNVTAGTAEEVKIQTLDANKVVLNEYTIPSARSNKMEVVVTFNNGGYEEGSKLYMPTIGNTATVKVVSHTYKYEDGKEVGVLEDSFTVTAVQDATTMASWGWTIKTGTNAASAPDWNSSSFKASSQIAYGTTGAFAYFNFKDFKGNNKTAGYKVSSSDSSKVILTETTLQGNTQGVSIAPVAEGSAYIIVKDKNDNVVTTLPVTVIAASRATTLNLSSTSVNLSKGSATDDKKTITLTLKDQYGNDMSAPTIAETTVEALNYPTDVTAATAVGYITKLAGKVQTVTGSAFAKTGTYTYKVAVKRNNVTVSNILTVNVATVNASGYATYELSLSTGSTVDLAVSKTTDTKTLTVTINELRDGLFYQTVTPTAITSVNVQHTDGTTLANNGVVNSFDLSYTTAGAIDKKAKAGTYNITVKADVPTSVGASTTKTITMYSTLTVKDTQVVPTISVKSTAGEDATLNGIFVNTNKVVFSYDGSDYTVGTVASYASKTIMISSFDYITATSSKTYTVKSAKVVFETANGGKVYATVPVNTTFTNVSGL